MAIVQLKKMTIYGAESQKESVVERLQQYGCVHLIDTNVESLPLQEENPSKPTHEALRYLTNCPEKRRQSVRRERFEHFQIVQDVLDTKSRSLQFRDEREALIEAIEVTRPWGEFHLPGNRQVGDVKFWFFEIPIYELKALESNEKVWREINRDHQNAYILVLSETHPASIPGKLVELDPRPLSELKERLEEVEELLEELHHRRVGLTRWCDLLTESVDEADDSAARKKALRNLFKGSRVFALQGWVPDYAEEQMTKFASDNRLAISLEEPAEAENPPTLLFHPERTAGSEALVTFYKTPEYRSWDPSIVSYISFALFFAMIIADAGYGLVLGAGIMYLWKPMGKTQGGRRGRRVVLTLVLATLVYGVMCGSYFGVTPEANSPLGRLRVLDAESQSLMMPLAILIGVIHLSIANLAIAWLQRGKLTALAPLGWVSVMIGATLAGIGTYSGGEASLANGLLRIGSYLLIGGLISVFLFTSPRPLLSLSPANHAWRALEGLQGLAGFSGLFGDVLSYLRLFALGLSSAKLSQTFNDLGASAWDSAGFGVIAAIAIVFLGHTLNLLLCLMSAVVHGLRLNCIEFFKWGVPEEGYSFKAFAKKARQT